MDVSRKIFTQLFNTELAKQNCEPFSSKEKKKGCLRSWFFFLSESNYGESKVRLGGPPNNSSSEKPSVRNYKNQYQGKEAVLVRMWIAGEKGRKI